MEKGGIKQFDTLLIAGLTPSFLERPALLRNENELIRKRAANSFLERNTIVMRKGDDIRPSEILRKLTDLGYQKTLGIVHRGSFKYLGSVISIFPINKKFPLAVEFLGNIVENIQPHLEIEKSEELFEVKTREGDVLRLKDGDFVVHIDHGIGVFRGIQNNYFVVEYAAPKNGAQPDRLFVPTNQHKRLSVYFGLRAPTIHRLGTPLWQNIKRKAKEDIIKFAKKLAELYKKRAIQTRKPYVADELEKKIWDEFPFEETAGQRIALDEIFKDLSNSEPMERLLAGDVGFGKTEVALRAALRVILNGRQVSLITPTTVLADQHAELFKKRLNDLPIKIERLTRLESDKKSREIVEGLKTGGIDIVIGTHRLLQKNIQLKNPGLLIVDEEQRFGVSHKEAIKERYPSIDILYLSATPIPRSLAFSLAGIRPLSQLKEAPRGRTAPLTNVLPNSPEVIKAALVLEKKRNGQSYYLINRIRSIPETEDRLEKLVPKLKKGIIHGKLSEKEIIRVMREFRDKKIDVLISTTIIENGLDISSVNTLIVEDSSRLGLAQAHQLRGRIGRGDKQSFAYFMYPTHAKLTAAGEKRLGTLEEMSYLGAGFDIARKDFEIRGAGNILGREQSGTANKIGWNLYFEMLNEVLHSA